MGPKIHTKSTEIASKRRSNLDPFLDLRFDRFRRRFCVQHVVQSRRFFDSGSQRSILRKPCFSLGLNTILEVRSSGIPPKNQSKNKGVFETRVGPRFGTVFGRFWGPKTEQKRPGIRFLGASEKQCFAKAMDLKSPQPESPGLGGFPLSNWSCV